MGVPNLTGPATPTYTPDLITGRPLRTTPVRALPQTPTPCLLTPDLWNLSRAGGDCTHPACGPSHRGMPDGTTRGIPGRLLDPVPCRLRITHTCDCRLDQFLHWTHWLLTPTGSTRLRTVTYGLLRDYRPHGYPASIPPPLHTDGRTHTHILLQDHAHRLPVIAPFPS